MSAVFIALSIFWIPAFFIIVRNLLWDLYNWQVKEYRVDRMKSHLLDQEEDYKQSAPIYFLKVLSFLVLISYLVFNEYDFLLVSVAVIFTIYLVETQFNLQMIIGKRFIRPKISFRNILVSFLSILIIVLPFLMILYGTNNIYSKADQRRSDNNYVESPSNDNGDNQNPSNTPSTIDNLFEDIKSLSPKVENNVKVYPAISIALMFSALFAVATDLITPIIVSFFVIITEPISQIRRILIIRKSQSIINSMPNLKVIGITGSYGKTTTKELLYQILSKKFKTVKTPKNYNSAVGIAIAAASNIKPDTEVFIAEMGAYTKNEVKKATEIAKPDISIVTGIDSQHLTLFGSHENIMKSKYEIIQNAKEDAVAILNGDNEYTLKMASMTDKKTFLYFTTRDERKIVTHNSKDSEKFPYENNIIAKDIVEGDDTISFSLVQNNSEFKLKSNLNTPHNVSNLLAAIAACIALGMNLKEVVEIINKTKFKLPYLNILNGLNNTTIIDDGYNANSTGFLSALKSLKKMKPFSENNKKFVMTKGIMELGWEKNKVYKEIAQSLIKSCDGLITSDHKLAKAVLTADPEFKVHVAKDEIHSFIKGFNMFTMENDIVLIEGSMHGRVLNEIIDKD